MNDKIIYLEDDDRDNEFLSKHSWLQFSPTSSAAIQQAVLCCNGNISFFEYIFIKQFEQLADSLLVSLNSSPPGGCSHLLRPPRKLYLNNYLIFWI